MGENGWDCLDRCGDDPAIKRDSGLKCSRMLDFDRKPRIQGIGRMADNPNALAIYLSGEPSDDDMREIHNILYRFPERP